jgi:multidrug efflux pump
MIRGGGSANIRIMLNHPDERRRTQQQIADALSIDLRKKTKARSFVMQQSTFGSRRSGMPVQYVLQATSIEKLRAILPDFMAKVNESEILAMADVNLKFTKPELRIHINRDKAISRSGSPRRISGRHFSWL